MSSLFFTSLPVEVFQFFCFQELVHSVAAAKWTCSKSLLTREFHTFYCILAIGAYLNGRMSLCYGRFNSSTRSLNKGGKEGGTKVTGGRGGHWLTGGGGGGGEEGTGLQGGERRALAYRGGGGGALAYRGGGGGGGGGGGERRALAYREGRGGHWLTGRGEEGTGLQGGRVHGELAYKRKKGKEGTGRGGSGSQRGGGRSVKYTVNSLYLVNLGTSSQSCSFVYAYFNTIALGGGGGGGGGGADYRVTEAIP